MQRVIFDFDIISPYAYLGFERLPQVLEGISHWVEYRPLLFPALLKHWGQKAPVEIPPRREFLFRQCAWIARREGFAFAPPQPHPFNPLALLRLIVASVPAGQQPNRRVVELVFRHVWAREGGDPIEPEALAQLEAAIGPVRDPRGDEVKAELQARTADAVAHGVFGVPTFRLEDGRLFWGQDAMGMLADDMRHADARQGVGA
jgi:2-hydroxychromene-2-carboxylate isomerase